MPHCRPPSPLGLESVGHQRHASTAVLGGCGVVLAQRIPRRTPWQPPQEPWAYCPAVCHAGRPHRGPHLPADVGCAGVTGDGGCPAAIAPERASAPPRRTPGKREEDDQHAHGGANPQSVSGGVADHPPDGYGGGNPALADALIGVAAGDPVSTRLGHVSVSTARKTE